MITVLILVLLVPCLVLAWMWLAPHDRDRWHVDPASRDEETRDGIRLIGLDAPRYPADAATVLETFRAIALSEPRVRLLDGSIDEGMLTFVARSPFIGLCDYITVKAVDEGSAAKLAISSRSGFHSLGDPGDPARLDSWLQQMEHAFGR